MAEENKNTKLLIKVLIGIITLLVIVVLLLLGWKITGVTFGGVELAPPETSTIVIPTEASSSSNSEAQITEATNWAFTLEYRFPAGFWSTGTHEYSLEWSCPNESPDNTTVEFVVSDNYDVLTGDVYLRWSSLKIGSPFGDSVEGINPAQPTVASIAWDAISKSEADSRAAICTGAISWDGGAKEPLTPQIPFQH